MKKIILFILVFAMAVGGVGIPPASAYADGGDMLSGEGIYSFSIEDAFGIDKTAVERSTENNRLYDYNAKMSWAGFGSGVKASPAFIYFNAPTDGERINVSGYNYINMWMYNPEVKKSTHAKTLDKISQMILLLRTGQNAADRSEAWCYRYGIPMDWTGWKLVSIPLSKFTNNRPGSANLDYGIYKVDLGVNGWESLVPSWPDGEHCAYLDAIWLSQDAPKTDLTVTGTSYGYGEGYVPADLGGDNTFVFETTSQPSETDALGAVTVKKDGEILSDGYTVGSESDKLKVIFDTPLQSGSTYDITVAENLYDIYGNILGIEYEANFTVEAPSKFFKITDSTVQNGAENVPLDLGGEKTVKITFNNPVDGADLSASVSILLNGIKLYDGYSIEADENIVYIKMNADLEPNGEYTIEFDGKFRDANDNPITGTKSISFKTVNRSEQSGVIWEYTDVSSIESSSNLLHSSENNRRNKDNAKLTWGTVNKMFSFFYTDDADKKFRATGYSYINAWIYNPEVKRNDANRISNVIWILRTGNSDSDVSGMFYYMYKLPMDWTGWKLVSVPIADFANGKDGSSLDYGIYRVSLEVNGWTGIVPAWTQNDNYAYVDMMWFSKEAPNNFVYVGSGFPNNYDNIPAKDTCIELAFTNALSYAEDDAVTLEKASDGETADVLVTCSGSRMTVSAREALEPDTEYCLKIGTGVYDENGQQLSEPAEYTFKTRKADLEVGKPVFSSGGSVTDSLPDADAEITVKSDVYNYSQSDKSAALIVCRYDGYGNMTDTAYDIKTFGEGAGELSASVIRDDKTVSIKAFVAENADDMTLLRPDYSVIGTDSSAARKIYTSSMQAEYGISLDKPELNVMNLKISGTSSGYDPVVIEIRDENNDLVLTAPIYADSESRYSYYYTFVEGMKSGIYTVGVHSNGAKSAYADVTYFDSDTRAEILEIINKTDNTDGIVKVLNDNKKAFGLDELGDDGIKNMAASLFEQRRYESYDDVIAMMDKITKTLDELNSKSWAGLSEFLAENKALILGDNSDYGYYTSLSEKNRNKINMEITKHFPVSGFASFREVFSDEISAYKKSNSQSGSSGSSGGGSVGGGNKTKSDTMGITPVTKPDANGMESDDVFDDISHLAWAKDSIMKLYNKNIISPSADKKFRPNDTVTREEFVKMIVGAFNITPHQGGSGFADAASGAWYEPYITAAKQRNIIMGDENGNFGVGKSITRQDMAVIIYRTFNAMNIWLNTPADVKSFTDSDMISDYAVQPLRIVQGAGIINGFEDGSFRPLENCTRAQAAKVIAELMETVG